MEDSCKRGGGPNPGGGFEKSGKGTVVNGGGSDVDVTPQPGGG